MSVQIFQKTRHHSSQRCSISNCSSTQDHNKNILQRQKFVEITSSLQGKFLLIQNLIHLMPLSVTYFSRGCQFMINHLAELHKHVGMLSVFCSISLVLKDKCAYFSRRRQTRLIAYSMVIYCPSWQVNAYKYCDLIVEI